MRAKLKVCIMSERVYLVREACLIVRGLFRIYYDLVQIWIMKIQRCM